MSCWPVVVRSALPLTTCTTVQEAYHTGAGGGLIPAHQTYVVLQPGARVPRDGDASSPRGARPAGCRSLQGDAVNA
jgi:hypothetical protein